jgi:hypothetical protein
MSITFLGPHPLIAMEGSVSFATHPITFVLPHGRIREVLFQAPEFFSIQHLNLWLQMVVFWMGERATSLVLDEMSKKSEWILE